MTDDKPREWWIVETKSSYFIYEDEVTANKERDSQASAYGYADVHHAKSDYDSLMAKLAIAVEALKYTYACSMLGTNKVSIDVSVAVKEALEKIGADKDNEK